MSDSPRSAISPQFISPQDGLLTLSDETGNALLQNCHAAVQLASGVIFATDAMSTKSTPCQNGIDMISGGTNVLPRIFWQAQIRGPGLAEMHMTVTNTTSEPLAIERCDVLVAPGGYRALPADSLRVRSTGWQSFSPSSIMTPFLAVDSWLQPPVQAPILPPTSANQRHQAWMTVLHGPDPCPPLLIGFGSAYNYLGLINMHSSYLGHRLSASNYVEGILLQPGKSLSTEPLIISWGKDAEGLVADYGAAVAQNMKARVAPPPTGWCSWYYYFTDISEADILQNLDQIVQQDLPLEYVQIDDGYQTRFGDWLSINDKFPHGMKYLADAIRSKGRRPGIWFAPFMADARSEVYTHHPDWFLHDTYGRPINVNRHGDPYWPVPNYGLDITHPEAFAWLEKVIDTICNDWGYEYIKADFLYAGAIRAKRYDPTCTSVQAYRRGLALIRKVAGDRFVVGCGAPLLCSTGYVDGMRINADIAGAVGDTPHTADVTLPLSRDAIAAFYSHAWMNGRLWVNDPDTVRLRQHNIATSQAETRAIACLVALQGGSVIHSDNLATLEPEGQAFLRRLLPAVVVQARPLHVSGPRPSHMRVDTGHTHGSSYILGLFNWTKESLPFQFVAADWEIAEGIYHLYDLLEQKYLGESGGVAAYAHTDTVAAHSNRMLIAALQQDDPTVITTNRHLLGPVGDLASSIWNAKTHLLTLITMAEPPESLEVLLDIPPTYCLQKIVGGKIKDTQERVLTVSPQSRTVRIYFDKN